MFEMMSNEIRAVNWWFAGSVAWSHNDNLQTDEMQTTYSKANHQPLIYDIYIYETRKQ